MFSIAVIIPAAGLSRRFNDGNAGLLASRNKLDEDLGGRPVLQRTVELFNKRDDVGAIIVAGPHDDAAFAEFELRHGDKLALLGATLCKGGKTHRYETVKAALGHVPESATHVAVHDAARPVTPSELIDRVFDLAQRHPAVIPAIPAGDTIKRVEAEPVEDTPDDPAATILGIGADKPSELRRVEETVDRDRLVHVQTPQVFEKSLLLRAYAQDDLESTDDAGLVERLGEPVVVTPGDPANVKITRPADVRLARALGGFGPPAERAVHKRF
ncbi:MAG: 2-C-methyl-D-erythritol 4-phosphate cytidylyltransferase [Phycisphaeraceae bacterium]|nr:MAG: 2-C-methyl-D-erythritol 4-phosphate cytidylyltransferase [Phycisphaeraceae bacterium]